MKQNFRFIAVIAICLVSWSTVSAQVSSSFKDSRDGKTYKTVKIGNQVWMAENLAFKADDNCWSYNNEESNVAKYGYLYIITNENVCPTGWRLPLTDDYYKLMSTIDKNIHTERHLEGAERIKILNGKSGFNVIKGGWRTRHGDFLGLEKGGVFATSEKQVLKVDAGAFVYGGYSNEYGKSIRCIKED